MGLSFHSQKSPCFPPLIRSAPNRMQNSSLFVATMNVRRVIAGSTCVPRFRAPANKFETLSVPMIDFKGLNSHSRARSLTVDDVGSACQSVGCFQVINHGISKSVINGAMEAASSFFELSPEEKKEHASEDVHQPVRYGVCSSEERIIKPRDFLKQYAHPLSQWIKFWPHSPADYREKMGKYAVELRRVALQLMDAILESLGLGQRYIGNKLEDGMQVMTLNSYEKCNRMPDSMLGLAPHSDYGCITILLQSCKGLQIIDRDSNAWKSVPLEFPDVLHVHIGDYFEVVSNGRYRSVVHRVILEREKRVSIASIHGFSMDGMVTVAKELMDDQHPKGYKDSSFRDFLSYITRNDFTMGNSYIDSLRIINP